LHDLITLHLVKFCHESYINLYTVLASIDLRVWTKYIHSKSNDVCQNGVA